MSRPSFWYRLTNPANLITTPEDRRLARLMASIFLAMAPLGFLTAVIPPLLENKNVLLDDEVQLMIGVLIIVMVLYPLSRSKFYKAIAPITILISSVAAFLASWSNGDAQDISALYYLVIPITLSIVFFSRRAFFITSLINGLALLIIPTKLFGIPLAQVIGGPLSFFILICVFVWLIDHYQRNLSKSRQIRLNAQYEQLQTLYKLSTQVAQAKSLEDIYQMTLQALRNILSVDKAAVLLFDTDGVIRFKASVGLSTRYQQRVTGHSPWNAADVVPEPVLINDVLEDDLFVDLHASILDEGIRSLAFVPLIYRSLLLGKFMIYYDEPHQFTESEIQLTQTIASQISFALVRKMAEQAMMQKSMALTRSNTFIAALSQVAARIESTPELDKVLTTLGQELQQIGISCMLALPDEDQQDLIVRYSSIHVEIYKQLEEALGDNSGSLRMRRTKWAQNELLKAGNAAYFSNPVELFSFFVKRLPEKLLQLTQLAGMKVGAGVCLLPLLVENELNGLLVVWGDDMVESDLPALSIFAGQVAAIIDRTHLFAALSASEERYRMVSELISDWAYAYRIDHHNEFVREWTTDAFSRATGYASDELNPNLSWLKIVHPDDRELVQSRQQLLLSGRATTNEYRIVTKSGEIRWIRDYSLPIFNAQTGDIQRVYGAAQDITTLRLAKERAYQQQKIESLGLMAGGVAHDFNNLLVAMMGQTSLALAKMPKNSAGRIHVEKAIKATERAAELTQQMLAYSGHTYYEKVLVDLRQVIQDNLSFLEATISKRVQLVAELPPKLPLIKADAGQIQQIVMNLVINAAEAVGDKAGVVTVKLTLTDLNQDFLNSNYFNGSILEPGAYICLLISDDGVGMDAETKVRIFDPFFTTKFTGRGLGLAAVMGIVQGHEGAIFVESEEGVGSTFTLFFPIAEDEVLSVKETAVPYTTSQKSAKILLIDDETAVREAVSDILELAGMQMLTAENGLMGIHIYEQNQQEIDLVMLDLSMPGLSGKETFHALKAVNPDVKVILSSGYNEAEILDQFAGQGLTGFIQKPYRAETLVLEVLRHLEN